MCITLHLELLCEKFKQIYRDCVLIYDITVLLRPTCISGSLNRSGIVDPEAFFKQYDAMKEDYESLRKRYADLIASHSGTVHKLELAQEEVNRVKKLYEDALQETSNAIRERNVLQQQCRAAIHEWQSSIQEKNDYKEALAKVQQQHEDAMREINQAMAVRIKLTKDRDAALQEYSLVMKERDTVHKELETLTDDLAQSKKEIKRLETQNKEFFEKIQGNVNILIVCRYVHIALYIVNVSSLLSCPVL